MSGHHRNYAGHVVEAISFSRGEVACACGEAFTIDPPVGPPLWFWSEAERHEHLADIFRRHRADTHRRRTVAA
jgi:hypothetical protein